MTESIALALIGTLLTALLAMVGWVIKILFKIQKGCGGCQTWIELAGKHIDQIDGRIDDLQHEQDLIKTDVNVIKKEIGI